MAPQKSPDKYIINIICDYSIATQFERLKLPSPQQLLSSSANNTNPNSNDSSDLLIAPTNNVCALCEDVGMERAALIVVTSGTPYMRNNLIPQQNNNNPNNHQQQQGEFEICCVVISLPQEIVRQLYKQGTLLKFLKDGLETIQDKYYGDACHQNKKKNIFKAFLVVEMPKNSNANSQQQQSENLTDASILAELMILQSATEGSGVISHCSFVNASPPSSAKMNNTSNLTQQTNNSNSSHNQKDDVASFIQALGLYLGRKAASISPNTDVSIQNEFFSSGGAEEHQQDFSIFSNFRSKVRDRDDSYTLLDPQFLTRGKIDTADWTAAYRGFLCEIEGITPQKAVSIISKFPTLRCLLDAIARKDQRSLAILADSVGGGGGGGNGNNRRVGDALVQKIIDKMTTKFDVKVALSSNARSFCQQ